MKSKSLIHFSTEDLLKEIERRKPDVKLTRRLGSIKRCELACKEIGGHIQKCEEQNVWSHYWDLRHGIKQVQAAILTSELEFLPERRFWERVAKLFGLE